MNAWVKSHCKRCNGGETVSRRHGVMVHRRIADDGVPQYEACPNWDSECRHAAESLGFYLFAWLPVKCRNGKRRWLRWVERHGDGTFSLGNRAF